MFVLKATKLRPCLLMTPSPLLAIPITPKFLRFSCSTSVHATNSVKDATTTTGSANSSASDKTISTDEPAASLLNTDKKSRSKGTIHDDTVIVGSPTNTRNFGKIKKESDLTPFFDHVQKPPKFDNEDQTGMDYNSRLKEKLDKINDKYEEGEEKDAAIQIAHDQIVTEMNREYIRELQFDPVEQLQYQRTKGIQYISTNAYSIPSLSSPSDKRDEPPREELAGGFVFGSIDFSADVTMDKDAKKSERKESSIVGPSGKRRKMPSKDDIHVVERP